MPSAELRLKSPTTSALACKICHGPSALYGVTDMSKTCAQIATPLSGVPVYYRRCASCGFLFTDAFDDWDISEFKTHIYNDEYVVFDPDYKERRPSGNGNFVTKLWSDHRSTMRVLDYGGGNDVLCTTLRSNGFKEAVTYDPMVPEHALAPVGKFDLITCFETLEHLPDPIAAIGKMAEMVSDPGAVFYSTLTPPADFHQKGMAWWYIGPRNGHVSIFTKEALTAAWAKFGFKNASLNDGTHLAFRNLPAHWGMAIQ